MSKNSGILQLRSFKWWFFVSYQSIKILQNLAFRGEWPSTPSMKIANQKTSWLEGHYCWWFRNPANQLRLVVYPIIYRALYIPGGCLGFLNHQQYLWFLSFLFSFTTGTGNNFSWNLKILAENHPLGSLYVYIYIIYTHLEPKWPLFWLEFGPSFGGFFSLKK